ncbi:MAG: discoidin domain-containing protein, partial [Bifidobacteriaceae bacterium]|nr:discoidin domain-containing protein [Bifidobacteriaceae bacterium]
MKNKKWCMPILMLLVGSFIPINVASAVAAESNNSNVSSIKEPGYYTKVDSTNFRASADSVATNEGRNGPADRVLDGDTNSFWSGRWGAGNGRTSMPMSLTICTADMNARNDISRASLVLRTSSNNSGRMKDYTVSITTETNITDNTQWTTLINESRPADDRSNVVIPLNDKSFTCMKVTYKSAWDGSSKEISNAASLAEVVFEQYHQGFQPIPQAPAGTGEGAIYPINSNAVDAQRILRPLAADERVADDAKQTPIALRLGERTIGARKSSTPAVAQVPQGRKAYYIDCSVPFNINAKGTLEDPWSSVDFANAHGDFNPGDFILLKRGSVCRGLLHPKGSGTAEQRITIDAYGDPNDNKPIIHALGQQETADSDVPAALKRQAGRGIESAAVRLFNQDYWVIRNLEITNYTNDHNDYQKIRRGVVVAAEDRGVTKGIEISDLYIHDVLGRAEKDLGGSGGIQFEAYAGDQVIPTWFEDLHVHHNVLKHVSRSGINEGSNFRSRTEVGGSIRDNPFQVWGPMDVHDNILSDIAGDAIVTQFASGTKVYNNTVWNYANHHGGKSPGGNNAGLWPWDADYVHYYNNHVFNSQMPNGTWDSTAFDADYGTTGTLFEYNVTHGNMGGFMLFCGCGGLSTNVTMRYNISINDGQGGERHNEGSRLFFAAGSADTKIHNNTFILYPGVNIVKGNGNNTAFTMVNNIFQANGDVKIDGNTNENIRTWAYNIYGGNSTFNWPDLDKEEHNNIRENNIEVGERVGVNAFQWEEQSNWIGRAIINKDIPDITGSTIVKWNDNPTRGAIQSPEHTSSASSTELVYDGGFELNKEGVHRSTWTSNTGSAIQRSSKFARSGQLSLAVQENEEISSEPISIGTHQTLRVLAAVKSAPEKNTLPTVQIRLSNGNIVTTKIYTASSEDNSDWTIVSSVFRTGLDTDRLEVLINGEGFVDDVSIINIPQQYAADPSLESVGNTVWSGGERVADNTFTGKLATKVNANQGAENRFVDIQARNQLIEVWVQAKKTAGDMRFGVKRFNDGDDQTSIPVTSSEYNSYSISLTPETSLITLYCYAKANSTGYCDDFLAVKPYTNAIPKHSGISYTPLDKVTVQTGQTPTLVNEIQVNWPDGTTTQENISWKDSSQWREVDDNTVEATGEFAGMDRFEARKAVVK